MVKNTSVEAEVGKHDTADEAEVEGKGMGGGDAIVEVPSVRAVQVEHNSLTSRVKSVCVSTA